jgi:hypothetical protein
MFERFYVLYRAACFNLHVTWFFEGVGQDAESDCWIMLKSKLQLRAREYVDGRYCLGKCVTAFARVAADVLFLICFDAQYFENLRIISAQ